MGNADTNVARLFEKCDECDVVTGTKIAFIYGCYMEDRDSIITFGWFKMITARIWQSEGWRLVRQQE